MFKKITLLLLSIVATFTTMQAQNWSQIGTDIDGKIENEESGWSVSINSDGSIVAIGSPSEDAGQVRIYADQSGTWTQLGNDIEGEAAGDYFGYAVSLSADGTIIAIGASENNGSGSYAGHVRVYEYQAGNWTQLGNDIDGEASYDNSGSAVSLNADGSRVAIGAHDNDGSGDYAGHVRVYEYQSGNWIQIGEDIDGEAEYDYSGYSVSLNDDGSIVAIGAPWNESSGAETGHVRVYEYQSGSWTQIGDDIYGEAEFDEFGYSVSLNSDGSRLAVGAVKNDGSGEDAGHVRIFENQAGAWVQTGNDIDGEAAYDSFGYAVSLSSDGSVVAIGAPDNEGSGSLAGHVRIFEELAGAWVQKGNDIDAEAAHDSFGTSVSLTEDGMKVAIGAPHNGGNGSWSGQVRVFQYISTGIETWQKLGIVSIYPNPTNGKIHLEFENATNAGADKIKKLIISDVTGKILMERTGMQQFETINLSGFESGVYIISFQTANKIFTTNILKK